ncbi:MAG: DedA family protein [Silicimonas sp.]|nr:DedA family protein [Silicimonas sp.]
MNEVLFGLVSSYGLPVVAISAFLSCLAVPIPTFAVMLAGGAFAATGDLGFWQVILTAYVAAMLGDQTGFQIGRWGGASVIAALSHKHARARLIERAQNDIRKWGGIGVFFSTWLFAPLGPWVNLVAGVVRMSWLRFTVWDFAGEAIWVTLYVSLGFLFGERLPELAELVGDWAGLISSLAVTVALGALIVRKAWHPSGTE